MDLESTWRSIETGPKEGREVLLYDGVSVHEGRYMMKGRDRVEPEGWYWAGYGCGRLTIDGHTTGAVGPIDAKLWAEIPKPPDSTGDTNA